MTERHATTTGPAVDAASADGRILRRERTRTAIVEAVFALLSDGELRPTAGQIAARAAVSERSVFQHFPERDGLLLAVAERQRERVLELLRPLSAEGPLAERLDAFVAHRARIWETITPVRRSALLHEPFSAPIHAQLTELRALTHAEVERVFAPELAGLDGAERTEALEAAAALAEWPTWESLRAHQGLGPGEAARAVRRALAGVLVPG